MTPIAIANKVAEFAAAHPNAVVCATYHKSWRTTEKPTHLYFVVRDGQPARLPAHKTIGADLPRYTLDLERGCAWRDYTEQDVYNRLLAFAHVNESHFSDQEWMRLRDKCRFAAAHLNRWLKNGRIAELRRKGLLS